VGQALSAATEPPGIANPQEDRQDARHHHSSAEVLLRMTPPKRAGLRAESVSLVTVTLLARHLRKPYNCASRECRLRPVLGPWGGLK
jgi:hypothetical protein